MKNKKKAGQDPVFDPVGLGIKDAEFWEHEYTHTEIKDKEK